MTSSERAVSSLGRERSFLHCGLFAGYSPPVLILPAEMQFGVMTVLLGTLGLHAAAFPRSFFPRSNLKAPALRRGFQQAPVDAPSIPCVVTISDNEYDVSAWAPSHPGGEAALRAFHGRNATCAFFALDTQREHLTNLVSLL